MCEKWAVIVDKGENVFCLLDVYSTKEEAIGRAYLKIGELALEYRDGYKFSTGRLRADGYGGYYIPLEFKEKRCEEPRREIYRILPADD